MRKYNCWEFNKCERGQNGTASSNMCPVAADRSADGLNEGINGGRICWIIAESLNKNKIKCCALQQNLSCFECEFRHKVTTEEGLLNICKATGIFLINSSSYNKRRSSVR
jgi:hypothetical protein